MSFLQNKSHNNFYKHGYSNHILYKKWENMKTRCLNQKVKEYKNYGGRGICICDEWLNSPKSFIEWGMKNGYEDGLTIDRINNDGNYEPSNCRWVTKKVQQRNQRVIKSNNTSGFKGVSFYKKTQKWVAKIKINNHKIHLGYFLTNIEAAQAYNNFIILNNLEHSLNYL